MKSRKGIPLVKDPEISIREAISKFIQESPSNRRKADGGRYFDSPLVGFASGDDPLFRQYKKIIGRFHPTPREIFNLTFGKSDHQKELSVISWVLPISEETRKANRKEDKYPSLLWSHTRWFGEAFNDQLRNHVVSFLKRKGYKAVAPANSPYFIHHMHSPKVGFTSNWSERHTAYACGLGTFGLCDGFITPRGKALRLGSVVTDLTLRPSERPYPHHHANCLYYFRGTCKVCAARCPCGAITSKGHDKDKCYGYMHDVTLPAKNVEYGVEIAGCGLCQTKVPCEFEIPKPIQKELQGRTK
jgi:hypothetical protein